MKVILLICLFSCIAFSSVHSASFYYRNGREIIIPVENELVREEIVSELRKETADVAAEEASPLLDTIVREEVLVPVDALRVVEPVVEVQEPAAIADTEVIVPVVSALRSAAPEVVAVPEAVVAVSDIVAADVNAVAEKEAVPTTRIVGDVEVASAAAAAAPATAPFLVADTKAAAVPAVEAIIGVKAVTIDDEAAAAFPNVVVASDDVTADAAVRQSDGADAPARPTLIQTAQNTISNLITNNPLVNAFQAIRNPQSDEVAPVVANVADESPTLAAAPAAAAEPAVAPTVTVRPPRPTLFQQLQNNVQQFQTQVQTAFQGVTGGGAGGSGGATGAASATGGENRPGFIAQIQQTVGQAINRPLSAIFRPNQQDAVTEQKETPEAIVVPAADEAVSAAAPASIAADEIVPVVNQKVQLVDDKIEESKKSD